MLIYTSLKIKLQIALHFSAIHNTFGLVLCNLLLNSTSKQFIMYIFGLKDDVIHSELDMNSSYVDFIIANAVLLLRLYSW